MTLDLWTVVEAVLIPIIGALVWYVYTLREQIAKVGKDLADHKLHVAENYATNSYLDQVEKRLTVMLTRIDDKLDKLQEKIS